MITYHINRHDSSLGEIVDWCEYSFGPPAPNSYSDPTDHTWYFAWEPDYGNFTWSFRFHQPQQATLFVLRWGQYLSH